MCWCVGSSDFSPELSSVVAALLNVFNFFLILLLLSVLMPSLTVRFHSKLLTIMAYSDEDRLVVETGREIDSCIIKNIYLNGILQF